MSDKKSLKDISWDVSEEIYRKDSALSYSTLSRFEREGFNNLDKLFEKVESPSLTFGSAVDAYITGGEEEFNNNFIVSDFPNISDMEIKIVKTIYESCHSQYDDITIIPDSVLKSILESIQWNNHWKIETRCKKIKEVGNTYYKILFTAANKTVLNITTYKDVLNAVDKLKNSKATSFYFAPNNPFEDIERDYQLKFKATLNDISYRCMADLLITDHKNKTVTPVDLKTSFKYEWDFYKSFIEWGYNIQAMLYWRIIRYNMNKDPYFKDFKLKDYKFIVVNKKTLCPLVWEFKETTHTGDFQVGNITFRDPENIGKELWYYLQNKVETPIGITIEKDNDIIKWINKL